IFFVDETFLYRFVIVVFVNPVIELEFLGIFLLNKHEILLEFVILRNCRSLGYKSSGLNE
ncbi:hypothetical protein LCGC14_1547960, partial [marine sediment metagenome]